MRADGIEEVDRRRQPRILYGPLTVGPAWVVVPVGQRCPYVVPVVEHLLQQCVAVVGLVLLERRPRRHASHLVPAHLLFT
jgi:hypothetical protein